MSPLRVVSLLGLAFLIGFSKAANLTSATCDATCQAIAQVGATWEKDQHALNDSPFYDVPSNFSTRMPPGTLLKVEYITDLVNYTVPSGLTMSRIMYTTTNLNGTILPTSAYILWPYAALRGWKEGGFPLAAWAHGTTGTFGPCAPSNYRNLQYHFMVPFLLALQGMVVVAPDYSGLGVDTLPSGETIPHPWAAGPALANDIANAIIAARAAFPAQLRPKGSFVALGHSEGGGASWSFAERLVRNPIRGYKGAVTIAPPTNVLKAVEIVNADPSRPETPVVLSIQGKLIASITAAFPAFNYSGLTALSYDRWFNVLKSLKGCLPTDGLSFVGVPFDQYAYPNWTQHPTAQYFAKLTETGRKPFKGPLLVISGEADATVAIDTVRSAVSDTCSLNLEESLEFVTYAGMNHFPVIQASSAKWLQWVIDQLLEERTKDVRHGCRRSVVKGFRTEFTTRSIAPNFYTQWFPAMEQWKYAL